MLRYVSDNVENENVPHVLGGFGFPSHENDVTTYYWVTDWQTAGIARVAFRN